MRGALALLVAVLLAGCGGDTDGQPVAPPTTPGPPEPRICTDERKRARSFFQAAVPREWDGAPFRFDLFDNFPEIAGADYSAGQLEAVQRLAERIEDQLGYPIIESGDVIPVPENIPAGWDTPTAPAPPYCFQWRKPGQMLGFHLAGLPDGHRGGGALAASPWCGTVAYWVGAGVVPGANGRTAVVHELFHLLGFKHSIDLALPDGVFMSEQLTRGGLAAGYVPTFEDIEALRCVFPASG